MTDTATRMRYALFANFENPKFETVPRNAALALAESMQTIVHAEQLGFDEAWVTEHHFNRFSVSASIFALLAHAAARTRRIKLGTAAVLLPMHDPIRVAEDAATVDALSGGRLLLGVARGGPFADQFKHFGVSPDDSRERMFEALALVQRLLAEEHVSFAGRWYRVEDASIYPRPVQAPIPIWLASVSPDGIARAAQGGHALMAPSVAPTAKLLDVACAYRSAAGAAAKPYTVSRFFFCAHDRRRAIGTAVPFVRDFARNMGAAIALAAARNGALPFGQNPDAFDEERILATSIIGDPAECIERVQALRAALGDFTLMLKPAAYDMQDNRDALQLFAERVRPAIDAR